ncbi:hypothetical protein CBG24_07180 [Limosilactobacillus reuteri]|uniref:Gram-positive cocci surface proteins LPxTG domain-containing protein n=1 Tax=Limosilactobacillus reuteri TaxID=1598 RepID=A0AB73PSR7_LIMRT|nr:DUF1542 domain-containing protein [Limosilactobacillus reuteri]OYS86467.1 hypothetical protein CBG19_07835 [Limosilactobacillus reuteri]OYS89000.1 hypothetical protein CBG18_08455 [Limosilactobacillus reuteri]OYS93031.1 hypothetical protein CBG10_09175 [Limosilactobacillus reuteri]OYS93821.1 hypothetical protein CBG15_05875 [Limosilactobacillus reuteri]OYS98821.1 hypothetical protein CBG13_00625 [Limosilactobacillus reuteri]
MVSKNNKKLIAEKNRRNEKQRFAIRKLNIGVASVLLGITFSIYGGGQAVAHADTANASDQVAPSDTGDNSLADKSEVALSNTALNASQSSTSATSANGAVQSQSSANSQTAVTANTPANDNAVASNAAVEATKNQSTAENQPSAGQEVQTPAQAQPVAQENGSGNTSLDATRQVLNAVARRNSNSAGAIHLTSFAAVPASTPAVATSDATAEDTNAVTVTDAQELIDAIQKGSATTINVANDINLAKVPDSNYKYIRKINTRDFTIKSATNGVKHTIDFSGYVFNMSTPNTVTFKDLDIYARSYWGVVYNAGGYVYDNVNFTGSQLIYTASNTDATVTFKNKVTATTVGSYTSPIDGKSRSSQGGDTQQILQFEGGTNHIIFDGNSNVTLGTTNSNVLEIDRGTATIDVKNGANVTINPHSKGNPENRNGIGTGTIARAIASNANTTINVDKGANLTINTEKASGDSDVAGALYLNSDATLNVNGDLNINSTGTPSTRDNGYPVYIAGNAAINVGNGGKFNLSATNTGSYNDNLMSISGKGTVKLAPHSNFKMSADGTGALTAISLSSGSTFTSDQPDSFAIDLSANTSTGKSLIKNGTINFTRVKTVTDGNESQPLGKIDVTYDRNGNATSYTITAQDENTVKQVGEGLANKNLIDLVKAGEDVTLSNLHLSKNNVLTGTVASSGSNNPIYVTVTVGGVSTNVPVVGNYTVYTNTNGTVTSDNVDYAAQTASTGGNFSIDLSKLASSLTDDAQVAVTATKDFVESSQTESVAALRALNTTTLQELVDAAPEEEKKASYYNATEEAQKAYTDAISTGKDILANPNNYDQVDVNDAVTAIQNAQKALTGQPTNKTELQDAIDQASTVESSDNYTNADSDLQKAYTDAISDGQTVLSNANATQTEVDKALTTINNAKDALNGDAKKAASKEALQKAVDEAPTVKSDDAAYYNGSDEAKTAYDKAVSAGQTVLADPDATATQITDALNAINTAKGNLKGEATDKSALQTAVDNSATVKGSNNYTNADETQKTAYDNAVTAAQTVLDKTNATQAEVNQALQDLETANNNLNGDVKTEAANKAALEAAVKDAPNVRNTPAYYNGSEEAQTAYNNAINAGQAVLNQANPSASDVKNALDAINAAKDNLKGEATNTEALETALTNANNAKESGNYTNADQANQEALNNAITAGQEILKNANATQAEVDNAAKAITDAINGLNGDTNLANAKNAATEDIQKALDTKTIEITNATNIDQATKDQLIADAKKVAEDANTAINQATNAEAVNTAKTEGITKINNVKIPSLDGAKQAANQAIDQALDTKTKEINAANNIDQATKDQLIKAATDAATTAKDAIEKATTNDAATKAGQDGVDAINNVKIPSVTDSQNAAKEAIDNALNAKTKEINDANNIDQTTKDQLIKEATDAANNAKEAIDKATTADAIKTAQDEGTTNINNVTVPSLEDAKKAANKAVDDALTAQTEVINKANNLSDAEKKDLIDQATAEANKAKENIETATTNNEAAQAGQDGVDAIKKIVPTSLDTVKSDANKAIDDALTKKLEEINSANDLTTDEKKALTQEANTVADKAKEEITKATTNAAVIEAQNTGVTVINDIKIPTESTVKETAKKAVADAATAKNNAIDSSNLTAEEKAALKQAVTEAQNVADQAIDNATTNATVTEAQTNGVNAINGIKVPTESTAKEAAKKAVAEAAEAKNNAIDSSNLTAEEKAALKQAVTDAQTAADQAIDKATTNAAVTKAQTNGVNAINGIKVPTESAVKEAAKKAVVDAATAKNNAIDSSNLTAEEKAALKQKVTEAQTAADQAIDNATTNAAVTEAEDKGIKAINGIDVPAKSDAKEKAITDLNNEVENAKKAIDQDSNLTDEEKQAAKDQIDSDAKTAQDVINNAKTNDDVKKAAAAGTLAIDKDVANAAIDNAAAGKKSEISNLPLTDEEKTALNNEVDQKAQDAKEAINTATTPEAVATAQENGIKNINDIDVPTESAAKQAAKEAVANAANEKNAAIDSSNLTAEEKAALKQEVTEAQNAANTAIDNATTNADVTEAKDNGISAIDGIKVPTTSANKEKAITDLNNEVENAKKAIDQDSNLTDEEKQAAKDQIDSDAKTAQDAIDNAKTDDEVKTAVDNGQLSIDKDVANAAIDNAVAGKKAEISNSPLTDEEKTALNNEVDQKAQDAKEAINNATTPEAVTTAQENGIKNINETSVPTQSAAKEAAKKAVADAATAKNNAIDASNLTDEEKAALKQKVTEAQDSANQAIDNATTNAAVTEAENKGVNAINGIDVPGKSAAKEQATTDLNTAVENAKKAIDQDSNLTDEEKQAAKDQIDSDAKNAQDAINNAKTNDDVKKAVDAGTLTIDKDVANAAIDNAVAGKKNEISNSPLTDEEKTALNNEVDQKAQDAKEAINTSTTPEAVATAQENGIKNINDIDVPTESAAKQAAKEAVANAANEKNAAIDSSNLTAEEKAALKQEVTEAQNAADQAIDNATTNAAVTEAKDNGVTTIENIEVPATSANKEKAITDLNNEVEKAKQAIDQDSNLTDEEKQAVKSQIDTEAKTAQDAINSAKTDNEVNNAVNSGKVSIDKDVANAAIDNAVAGKLKEIQDPLTTDEKQAYTDLINSEANNAKQNIANATTVEEVTTAQNSGVDAINKIEVPTTSTVKDDAIKAIDKALQNKTDEINNASNINPQEKTDLINQATEAANAAKNNINNATTNADVDTAQTNGEKAIADVTVPNLSDVKKESIDLINKALDAKTDEINNASNLSQDEKQSLINDATNAATEAINNINQSQTNDDAKAAATTGVQNIENVTIPTLDDAKKNANQAIDDALNSKVNEINNASNLNDTEKQKLVDQATEAATTAKNSVENATTNDAARDAANAGIDNIKGIRFTSLEDAKKVANTAIDNALQVKTDEINNASNLSTEEKQDLINQASEAAKNAKDNINNATTNDAVTDAQNKGIADIANVTVPSLAQAKQDAINAIKQVQDAKNKQISAASNLSAKEQKELTDQVDKIANDAIAKINDAATTTNDAVTAIRDDAIKQITDLFIPTLDGAQTDALNAIESAKNAKLNDINNAVHLTDQEKQALVDQTNKAADEATKAINAAQTNDEVKSAETAGLDIINNITIPTLVQKQQEAIEELNAARDAKNSAIDNAADLTTDEKNSLKDKVQAEYSNAVSNITSATTDEAVTTAKENGIAAIKDIQIPTKSAAKEQATTDLNTAVDDAKKAIDQDSNLTDEEKQAAKDQIDSDAKKVQEAIDNAKTDDEVNSAVDNGKLAIDKDIANAAIDNAAAGKKAEIAKSPLTDEEKTALNNKVAQKAQDAKEAINDATTPEAVTTAQENGIKKINDTEVPTESAAKEAAKKAVAEAAETKNNAIDSSNLTNEEKTALKQEVTDAQNAANTAIDNATTNAAVTEAEDNGIKAINGIEVPTKSAAKEQATTDLNDAVDDAKKAIDQDSNLTDEEKQAAKDQIDSDAKKAQEVIDNAKTADEVKTAVDNGQLAIDKDVANAAIDNAVAGKKAEIAKAPLTTDEAKALNDLVDQEAKAAKKAIDSATTIPAVEDAKNTGVAAINDIAVPTTSSTKDQANQTIDDALANKTKEINDATNLSNKQKQDLIDEATDEAAKAKENIKNATSNEAVNKATTDGVDAIANVTVPSLDDAKKDASQLIDDVLKQKEAEINNASHLTDQEKQDLIHQAQNAADEAKDKINQATTNDDVATERDAGAEKIANIAVPSLDDAKDKATKAIDDALADKTKEINEQTHLSDQEKNDLIKQITDIADKAKDKINNDSNDAEVAKDEKEGIDAIVDTKVPGLEDHKQNAIKSLDEAKSTKLAQIDEAGHLTADEKANLTQQVDAEYNKALDNINKATTNDDADKASADGVEAILNVAVPSLNEKKQDSIDALNEVRDAKKEEINNANNLNQDEKDELTKQVDQIADNAINAINGAKDDQTAKNAENKGIQDILDVKVPSLDEVKTNAKQAIADALESKTNEINAASNLDSATKQELINRANAEADTAIEKIDQATSNDQALAASQAGVDKILGIEVPTLADAKQSAIDAINDALKQKETEINNASQLTSDEKQNLINQVNSIADNAKDAIDNATTNQSVEETKNAGIEKINAINVPTTSAAKNEAIKAIDDALTNKVNEINNATNITAEEKVNLIDEAKNAANTAKDNIDQATSDSEVTTATTDGINAIANVIVPSLETAKDQAKNLIDDVLNEKKNEINNAQNLSDSQKQDLINQATDEADQAKKNIDNATTNNDVQTAEDNGAQAIENVTVPSLDDAKKASTKVIDEVLKEKMAEINAATNLSNTEKDALIKDATTAANTAKDNIAKATTNDAVKDAETDGVKAILDIKVPGREDQQKDAIAALDRALADKVSEIDNANNLSETTKQDLKQQAQAAYTTAVDNVNNAQTSAEINAARDNGVQAILDITVPTLTDAQDASITAVEQVRDAKKTQIEAAKNLTETQKEALKNQVDEIADKAIDNIKNATTDATVKDAETAGINEILNVTIPTLNAAKSDAKQAIADALTAKMAEINAAQNLTDAEKQKLIDQAQTEAAAANKNIDAATTNDAAELAAKNGVQAILDIQVPTVEETRDQAKKNVDNALNSKKEEINNSNLSPAAKEALINEAEQAAENARTAIDNATTASAIGEAEAAGIAAIENIKVSNASTESDNSSNHQTNTETPTEGNSASQDNNNATQAPVQGNNTQADLTGSHGTNLTIGQQTEKAADTNSKETLPQTGNETERGLSIAGLAIASLLGLFGLSGLGKKRD